ncbi:MAG TPA: class I SAM-dependent methyltransferase [Ohtaekwangia sp.]|uniref:class I SAM-dependent methyltransferase n=1 Tax=Ohtaekwangia sp. TaxID=2066019 RepID=UPI002F9551FA
MNIRQSYNQWASQYDTNVNRTRDLEAQALRKSLHDIAFDDCLEIGCGTGKNTVWLVGKAKHITAVDFSEEMLAKAKEKVENDKVYFHQADISKAWTFRSKLYDLVSFSLVLEHINDLDHVFRETSDALRVGGYVYIGELHPYRQYGGTKARFETEDGIHILECFDHNISDFIRSAAKYNLLLLNIDEYFDSDERTGVPRILQILLRKV